LLNSSIHKDLAWLHTAPVSYITQLKIMTPKNVNK